MTTLPSDLSAPLLAVTGGAGFVGSHLVAELLARGYRVLCLDLFTYAGATGLLESLCAGWSCRTVDRLLHVEALHDQQVKLWVLRGDINDTAVLTEVFAVCDGVFALAAETHVDYSFHAPGLFVRANISGTQSVLEAWRAVGEKRRLLHVSTDEVYGEVATGCATEDTPLRPRNPYAVTKAAGDMLVQSYASVFGMNTVIVRPCNIYGPGQQPKDLLPKTLGYLMSGRKIPIHGDGAHVREYLFVRDAVCLIADLFLQAMPGEIYNLSSGVFRSTTEAVRAAAELLGALWPECAEFVADRPHPDRRYACDSTKARTLLGPDCWHLTEFTEGLRALNNDYQLRQPRLLS